MDISHSKILLIGAGNMGGALLGAWLTKKTVQSKYIALLEADPVRSSVFAGHGIHIIKTLADAQFEPDCIVLAVKPQSMDQVLSELSGVFADKPLYLSIAAGKTLAYFARHLGDAPVVRAMPNTPAIIGAGISAFCANARVSNEGRELARQLLLAAGDVVMIEDETLMDAVTAISGSGPAYVFLFMEALAQAGMQAGLTKEIARRLALSTVGGSAALALASSDTLSELRAKVTSPGGTTQAALDVLMRDNAQQTLIEQAVGAAIKRAKELS